jgi:MFS transporter, DHA3 family, macrolide efflux protein
VESPSPTAATVGAPTSSARGSYRRVLARPAVRTLWLAQLISQSGDIIFELAVFWLVASTAGSLLYVGLLGVAVFLPQVVVGPFAGVWVDRTNRGRLVLTATFLQGVVTAVISLLFVTGHLYFVLLFALVFALGALAQFVRTATEAVLPVLLPKEDLAPANALFALSSPLNQLASLAFGGVVIALLGVAVPIIYDSVTFFVAAALLLTILPTLAAASARRAGEGAGGRPPSFVKDLREGVRYVRSQGYLFQVLISGLLANFFAVVIIILLAPYARTVLSAGAATYGLLLAGFAVGSLVGVVATGRMNLRSKVGTSMIVALIVAGAGFCALGLVHSVLLALPLMFVIGVAIPFANIPLQAMVQARVPNQLLGRVGAVLAAGVGLAQPVASVFAGGAAQVIGIAPLYLIAGVAVAVVGAGAYVFFPALAHASY